MRFIAIIIFCLGLVSNLQAQEVLHKVPLKLKKSAEAVSARQSADQESGIFILNRKDLLAFKIKANGRSSKPKEYRMPSGKQFRKLEKAAGHPKGYTILTSDKRQEQFGIITFNKGLSGFKASEVELDLDKQKERYVTSFTEAEKLYLFAYEIQTGDPVLYVFSGSPAYERHVIKGSPFKESWAYKKTDLGFMGGDFDVNKLTELVDPEQQYTYIDLLHKYWIFPDQGKLYMQVELHEQRYMAIDLKDFTSSTFSFSSDKDKAPEGLTEAGLSIGFIRDGKHFECRTYDNGMHLLVRNLATKDVLTERVWNVEQLESASVHPIVFGLEKSFQPTDEAYFSNFKKYMKGFLGDTNASFTHSPANAGILVVSEFPKGSYNLSFSSYWIMMIDGGKYRGGRKKFMEFNLDKNSFSTSSPEVRTPAEEFLDWCGTARKFATQRRHRKTTPQRIFLYQTGSGELVYGDYDRENDRYQVLKFSGSVSKTEGSKARRSD